MVSELGKEGSVDGYGYKEADRKERHLTQAAASSASS